MSLRVIVCQSSRNSQDNATLVASQSPNHWRHHVLQTRGPEASSDLRASSLRTIFHTIRRCRASCQKRKLITNPIQWSMDEVRSECVLCDMGIAMSQTPMPHTHEVARLSQGDAPRHGRAFLWSKFEFLRKIDQWVQKPTNHSFLLQHDYSLRLLPPEASYWGVS